MTRALVLGIGPLPVETARWHNAPGLRTWHFAWALDAAGHTVRLLASRAQGAYPEHPPPVLRQKQGRIEYFSVAERTFADPTWLRRRAAEFEPECVVGVTTFPASVAARLDWPVPLWADLMGAVMAEAQMKALVYRNDSYLRHFFQFEFAVAARADRISVVAHPQRDFVLGELGFAGRLNQWTVGYPFVSVIPVALTDTTPFPEMKPALRGAAMDQDACLALFSGGYNTWTDVDTLAAGLLHAMDRTPRLHFASVGGQIDAHDEISYPQFQARVTDSPHAARFHFAGWLPAEALPAYYAAADLAINADRDCLEAQLGTRNRMLDWMRAGLPCVTPTGAELARHLVEAGAAFAYPPGDAEALGATLARLATDRPALRQAGQRARQLLLEAYDPERVIAPLLEWIAAPTFAPDHGHAVPRLMTPTGNWALPWPLVSVGRWGLDGLRLAGLGRVAGWLRRFVRRLFHIRLVGERPPERIEKAASQ